MSGVTSTAVVQERSTPSPCACICARWYSASTWPVCDAREKYLLACLKSRRTPIPPVIQGNSRNFNTLVFVRTSVLVENTIAIGTDLYRVKSSRIRTRYKLQANFIIPKINDAVSVFIKTGPEIPSFRPDLPRPHRRPCSSY